ncbi:MAG: cobalamin-dependent protein [bacterium]|nr:cobalamin-dependent protein [bacterium]
MLDVLLVGPYDPLKGNQSFIAPPLGIWRICGFVRNYGIKCAVFDPNLYLDPYQTLMSMVKYYNPKIIGFSITSMTLPYDLSLINLVKSQYKNIICIGGGIGATFEYETVLNNSSLDYCVMGEGEIPLLNICTSLKINGVVNKHTPGLVYKESGIFIRNHNIPLDYELFKLATFSIPYQEIPVTAYWHKIKAISHMDNSLLKENTYHLREVNSIRLMTSNYCPMNCSFCCYTNFLSFANNCHKAKLVRLTSKDIILMLTKITSQYPSVKTIIFQDDIFVLRGEKRNPNIFEDIIKCKKDNLIPEDLTFIASCRIDSLDENDLKLMKSAGFRLIGYGVESFSINTLKEYNKETIYNKIDKILNISLEVGIKPFLDIILISPDCSFNDVFLTLSKCIEYLEKGCEVSIYPSVIPFAGSKMTQDPGLQDLILYKNIQIPLTKNKLLRGISIQPRSKELQDFIQITDKIMQNNITYFKNKYNVEYFPSRLRSLLYIMSVTEAYPVRLANSPEYFKNKILTMVEQNV